MRMVQARGRVLAMRSQLEAGDDTRSVSSADTRVSRRSRSSTTSAFARVAARYGLTATPRGTRAVRKPRGLSVVSGGASDAVGSVASTSLHGRSAAVRSDDGSSIASSRLSTAPSTLGAAAAIARAVAKSPEADAEGTNLALVRGGGWSGAPDRHADPHRQTRTPTPTPPVVPTLAPAPAPAARGLPPRQATRSNSPALTPPTVPDASAGRRRARSSFTGAIDSILNDSEDDFDDGDTATEGGSCGGTAPSPDATTGASATVGVTDAPATVATADSPVLAAAQAVNPHDATPAPPPPPPAESVDTPHSIVAGKVPAVPARPSIVADPLGVARFSRHHRGSSPVAVTVQMSPHLGQPSPLSRGPAVTNHPPLATPPTMFGAGAGAGAGAGTAFSTPFAAGSGAQDMESAMEEVVRLAGDVAALAAQHGHDVPADAAGRVLASGAYSLLGVYNYLGALVGLPPARRVPLVQHCTPLEASLLEALRSAHDAGRGVSEELLDVIEQAEAMDGCGDSDEDEGGEDIDWATSSDEDDDAGVAQAPLSAHPQRMGDAKRHPFVAVHVEELELPQVAAMLEVCATWAVVLVEVPVLLLTVLPTPVCEQEYKSLCTRVERHLEQGGVGTSVQGV